MDRQFIDEALELDFMENTQSIFFEDDTPKWYVAMGDQWTGPLAAADVYERVEKQQISMAHFVWTPGQPGWQRICDTKAFQVVVPGLPPTGIQSQVETAAKPVVKPSQRAIRTGSPAVKPMLPELREWFLYHQDSQFGPFTRTEVLKFLQTGRIDEQVHAWKDGLKGWEMISTLSDFALEERLPTQAIKTPPPPAAVSLSGKGKLKKDNRQAPRLPMVAKIVFAIDDTVLTGIGRDVSVGGMQVLAERVPGTVGTKLKLNVSPTSKTQHSFNAFTAVGTIVRILEDGRGFSFRFETLTAPSKKAIEEYIDGLV